MDETRSWLALVRAPGLGSAALARLLERFDSAPAIVCAGRARLQSCALEAATLDAIVTPDERLLQTDLDWLSRKDHHLIWRGHTAYPSLLEQTPGAPAVLFGAGDITLLGEAQLAMVGSRNPTAAGLDTATAFAAHLARAGLVITSGMARGIDTAAHRGALQAGGATIAVCGTGLDQVYPRSGAALAEKIRAGGLLISEFPPGTPARRGHFPQRNRIIAGLSLGTLVVEAAHRSGSLITAHRAIEAGREVFAIPGSIHNPMSRGCHRLIREGAKLVESTADILIELAPVFRATMTEDTAMEAPEAAVEELGDDYRCLLDCVGYEPTHVDTIVTRSGLTAHEVSSMLLILELRGYISPSPQGGYSRTAMRPDS